MAWQDDCIAALATVEKIDDIPTYKTLPIYGATITGFQEDDNSYFEPQETQTFSLVDILNIDANYPMLPNYGFAIKHKLGQEMLQHQPDIGCANILEPKMDQSFIFTAGNDPIQTEKEKAAAFKNGYLIGVTTTFK